MAISFITGVARSGKSFFSVSTLYNMYKNDVMKKTNFFMQWYRYYVKPLPPKTYFDTVYTNINQFNFAFSSRIKPLIFKDFLSDLTKLHYFKITLNFSDDDLIIEAKKLGLFNCLIIFDEAAHYFTKPINDVLVWWLTYHGHLHHEVHIITQHMDQIPNEYLKNGEFFYLVYPSSKALSRKSIQIGLYSCIKFYKKCKTKHFSIPFDMNVAKMYVSGKPAKRELVMKKYIIGFVLVLLALIYAIYNFFSYTSATVLSDINQSKTFDLEHNVSSPVVVPISSLPPKSDSKNRLMFFNCSLSNCTLKNNSISIPLDQIKPFFEEMNIKPLYTNTISTFYTQIAVSVPETVFQDFSNFNLNKGGTSYVTTNGVNSSSSK